MDAACADVSAKPSTAQVGTDSSESEPPDEAVLRGLMRGQTGHRVPR
jgi:hypothetical protein